PFSFPTTNKARDLDPTYRLPRLYAPSLVEAAAEPRRNLPSGKRKCKARDGAVQWHWLTCGFETEVAKRVDVEEQIAESHPPWCRQPTNSPPTPLSKFCSALLAFWVCSRSRKCLHMRGRPQPVCLLSFTWSFSAELPLLGIAIAAMIVGVIVIVGILIS